MNADQRRWVRMIALLAIVGATAMASQASGAEPLFLLTSQIERLGGEEPMADSNEQSSQDDSLRYDGLRLTGGLEIADSDEHMIVPAHSAAPIRLEMRFRPILKVRPGQLRDHPVPQRDDSNLLAKGTFDSMTLPFNR